MFEFGQETVCKTRLFKYNCNHRPKIKLIIPQRYLDGRAELNSQSQAYIASKVLQMNNSYETSNKQQILQIKNIPEQNLSCQIIVLNRNNKLLIKSVSFFWEQLKALVGSSSLHVLGSSYVAKPRQKGRWIAYPKVRV